MKKPKPAATPEEREKAFATLPVPRALARFVVPTVLSQLAFLLLNLADAFFVGRTGDMYQVSAMTITFPVIMMMNCVTTIFAAGGNAAGTPAGERWCRRIVRAQDRFRASGDPDEVSRSPSSFFPPCGCE